MRMRKVLASLWVGFKCVTCFSAVLFTDVNWKFEFEVRSQYACAEVFDVRSQT